MKKSLFGYGITTKAISQSGNWDIYDDKFGDDSFDEFKNRLLNPCKFNPNISELEIPSPGFPPHHKLIKSAKNIISEYDYFYDNSPKQIWISGTNGKTTTTKMIQHLLCEFSSVMGGNVGTPLALLEKKAKLWVLETSSFTLHYTKFAVPNIYILLNITPDHLSWHGSMKEYENSKLKPLKMMSDGGIAIVPQIYSNINSNAKLIGYEDELDLARKFNIDIEKIEFKTPFLIDAILSLCVSKIIYEKTDYELLNNFKIESHKLEEVLDKYERLWVNDTKATNLDATIQALKRYKHMHMHLILGGDDKGVDLSPIFEVLKDLDVIIYAIGSNCDKIAFLANKFNVKFVRCEFLESAVLAIDKGMRNSKSNIQVGLLSPACASLDQFSSYAQRGELFKSYLKAL